MVLFYEGKKMVGKLRENKVEVTEERMLRFNEDKSELIFFEDISSVRAHRGLNGNIDKIKIRTAYNETVFENFDDMEELLEIIELKTEVSTIKTGTKQIYNSLAMIAVLSFSAYFIVKL